MNFRPIKLMMDRVQRHGDDSDSVLFNEYLYAGELVSKLNVAALVAAIQDDRQNSRYSMIHKLVRSDGVGDWSRVLDEVVSGPASQNFLVSLFEIRRSFNERLGKESWQHQSTKLILEIVADIKGESSIIPEKIAFKSWFSAFSELRNKTRGHGATTPAAATRYAPKIAESIKLICEHNLVFKLPWAYLHRNLSGKYRVVSLGGDQGKFSHLKSASARDLENYRNGIYLWADKPIFVELINSDTDATDFFVPNGGFSPTFFSYELLSLISDARLRGDAKPYSLPPGEKPPSETEGQGKLSILKNTFSNIPQNIKDYIHRPTLERDIEDVITNDRHPIVTLVGRGGVGKTSLALAVLDKISLSNRFSALIWFSARDIDLTMFGAKPVQPRVLTELDISKQYIDLIQDLIQLDGSQIGSPVKTMAAHLRESPIGSTLYIFDNFETLRSPVDLFNWIDLNIRMPNKVVITSRFREFKADYPVNILGMEKDEASVLISGVSARLNISEIIGATQSDEIYEASNGHPYIIKIILGEIADLGHYSKPANIISRKDELLDALFERTFANLSPASSRIFLTMSGWRSPVPRLALEAVLLRHGADISDPEASIDHLVKMSLIESNFDERGYETLEVPLSAAIFGKRKMQVSPMRGIIEADTKFLQEIGAITSRDAKVSIKPQIETFFKKTAKKINEGFLKFDEISPILEFLSNGYPDAWILLSELASESNIPEGTEKSANYLRRYLELNPDGEHAAAAWEKLTFRYRSSGDAIAALGAFIQFASLIPPPVEQMSEIANAINNSVAMKTSLELIERHSLLQPLIFMLEGRINSLSATDMSRLAWLYLHSGNKGRAYDLAEQGAALDSDNTHCRRLLDRLQDEI
jgi:hypothetical protein